MSLYQDLTAAGIPIDNHESDLYFPATPAALEILAQYPQQKKNARHFVDQTKPPHRWVDVPFEFDPWWEGKAKP